MSFSNSWRTVIARFEFEETEEATPPRYTSIYLPSFISEVVWRLLTLLTPDVLGSSKSANVRTRVPYTQALRPSHLRN